MCRIEVGGGDTMGNFIGYEYKELRIERGMEGIYLDSFPCFGWEADTASGSALNAVIKELRFKRDRSIRNKAELTRLQRQFEASVHEITALEKSRTAKASIAAFSIGIIATALLAGATFSYLGGVLWLMVLLAIPGFLGWILPYFCYRSLYEKRSGEILPLIEAKYDEIYEICEKANRLRE